MPRTAKITALLIIGVIVVLGGWDIIVAANTTDGDTISEMVLAISLRRPIVPFVVGIICGHLFWPQPLINRPDKEKKPDD